MSDKIDLEGNKVIPVPGPTVTSTNVTMEMIVGSVEIGDDGNSKVNYFVKFSTENSNHHILYPWEGLKSLVLQWVNIEKEMGKNVE
jgi:hypothetical protein